MPAAPLPAENSPIDLLRPTIFHEDWWLKITTSDNYAVAEVSDQGRVVGRLPYMLRKRYGFGIIDAPPLTHFLGPAVLLSEGKPTSRKLRYFEITEALIEQLPAASRTQIRCQRDIEEVMAFQANGFVATVQFTREIHPQPVNELWDSLHKKCRNNIVQAEKLITIDLKVDPSEFTHFYARNLQAKDKNNYLDMCLCKKLIEACLEHNQGCVVGARDNDGSLIAAIVCVWDHGSCYYLMSTHKPDSNRGASSALVWNVIKDRMNHGQIFDFDGLASSGGARFSASFSATVTPRYIVTRDSVPMQFLRTARSVVKGTNFFCD